MASPPAPTPPFALRPARPEGLPPELLLQPARSLERKTVSEPESVPAPWPVLLRPASARDGSAIRGPIHSSSLSDRNPRPPYGRLRHSSRASTRCCRS